jgi:hypothetical protein
MINDLPKLKVLKLNVPDNDDDDLKCNLLLRETDGLRLEIHQSSCTDVYHLPGYVDMDTGDE